MKKIEAYKCELTGGVYEDRERAVRSEFIAMMKSIGGSLPHMGSVNSTFIMEWLAGHIESEIYPTVLDKLVSALEYYRKNRAPRGVDKADVLPKAPVNIPMPTVKTTLGPRTHTTHPTET